MHFGASAEFFPAGLYHGVTDQQKDLARAIKVSGIQFLRFPGGDPTYYYLPESAEKTMQLMHACGNTMYKHEDPPYSHFVPIEKLADFCKTNGIGLMYELPCLFYLDGDTPRAIVKSRFSDTAKNYDRDRIYEGVTYGLSIAKRLIDMKAPIVAWEIGNEEFAHCSTLDYGKVAASYIKGLKKLDPSIPVIVEGMDRHIPELASFYKRTEVLESISGFRAHYPFGNWPAPESPDRTGNADDFLISDLKIELWLDVFNEIKAKAGITGTPTSVTETYVMHYENWDQYKIICTHAHALAFAWNWMTLLERTDVDMAVYHELQTPWAGMIKYDVGYFASEKSYNALSALAVTTKPDIEFRRQYVLTPTALANSLLSTIVGERIINISLQKTPELRAIASKNRVILVNRGKTPVQIQVPFTRCTARALTADEAGSCLPGTFSIAPQAVTRDGDCSMVNLPPLSLTLVVKSR
ncbi:MAG: hypothetical protein ACYC27_20640 [Armatimonadota bacterium]